jgi:hypothetical protein
VFHGFCPFDPHRPWIAQRLGIRAAPYPDRFTMTLPGRNPAYILIKTIGDISHAYRAGQMDDGKRIEIPAAALQAFRP